MVISYIYTITHTYTNMKFIIQAQKKPPTLFFSDLASKKLNQDHPGKKTIFILLYYDPALNLDYTAGEP